jgi:energy-coupling factor transporter ATP-binding protein EcfA2
MPEGALAIRRITVEKLFGRYSYDLRAGAPARNPPKLLILYGDNGSGKTTLLQLVFNLLTHIDKRGHKSFLAKTKFKKLVIDLGERTQVVAMRRGRRITGTYTAFVRRQAFLMSTRLTPLESALPQNAPLTLLEWAVPKICSFKSFRMRRCEKSEGGVTAYLRR